jgi:FAD:protein FMN transferase
MASLTRCQGHLGTYVEITVSSDATDEVLIKASNAAFSAIKKIDSLMSFHSLDSEVTRINKNACFQSVKISPDTAYVIEQALLFSNKTNGIFDITIASELIEKKVLPDHHFGFSPIGTWEDIALSNGHISFKKPLLIDLGGIAKGYAVDCAINATHDSIDINVNAGGDIRMRPWRNQCVSIRHPDFPHSIFAETAMKNCSVATSAGYYSDIGATILARDTNLTHHEIKSVTVFAETCLIADALTKVAYLNPSMLRKINQPNVYFASLGSDSEIIWN